jgi:hypothetical protein
MGRDITRISVLEKLLRFLSMPALIDSRANQTSLVVLHGA